MIRASLGPAKGTLAGRRVDDSTESSSIIGEPSMGVSNVEIDRLTARLGGVERVSTLLARCFIVLVALAVIAGANEMNEGCSWLRADPVKR
jgi:hypothetical protein